MASRVQYIRRERSLYSHHNNVAHNILHGLTGEPDCILHYFFNTFAVNANLSCASHAAQ